MRSRIILLIILIAVIVLIILNYHTTKLNSSSSTDLNANYSQLGIHPYLKRIASFPATSRLLTASLKKTGQRSGLNLIFPFSEENNIDNSTSNFNKDNSSAPINNSNPPQYTQPAYESKTFNFSKINYITHTSQFICPANLPYAISQGCPIKKIRMTK